MLTDFGSAVFTESTLHLTGSHSANGHSLRWTPPEIIRGDLSYFNKEADIYSLGMETISGRIPYYNKQNEATVMYAVLSGKEPPLRDEDRIPRESKHGNILWDLLVRCWQQDSQARPSALDVMRIMSTITDAGLRPTGK
ncbi:Ephrin type-A receptor 4 [Ceratobasidium sp. AG-Ba]|nr:Ephrin type-A receptor 4 [Ceratobasidium sp. AG-Ba]